MKKLFDFLSPTVAAMVFLGLSAGVVQAGPCNLPDFASATFENPLIIDNPYMPLVPGTTFIYEPVPNLDKVKNTVEVLPRDPDPTKRITITVGDKGPVECLTVHDFQTDVNGDTVEDTFDYFAQDDDGNVWYCGEDTRVFLPGGGIDKTGSFIAGKDVANIGKDALPGIVMLAVPRSGECYKQEFYPGQAEDEAKVMRLNANVTLHNRISYEDCLETKEESPLERGAIEQKFYAPGVGLVLNFEHHGKLVRNELISVTP